MPHNKPNYGTDRPEVQGASKATFSELSSYLSSVIEARLFDFKCKLSQINLFIGITCL